MRDNFDAVRDESGYVVPAGPADEITQLLEILRFLKKARYSSFGPSPTGPAWA